MPSSVSTPDGEAVKQQAETWVITNGAAGNERQALALANALGGPVRTLVLLPQAPWSWLAPRLIPGAHLAWPAATRRQLRPPWPRLAIGCGRSAALFTRLLRLLSEGQCRSVQILDPRIDPRHWDLVIAPQHDQLQGPNVISPLGSLHPVDDTWLEHGRQAWAHLGSLPEPRLGVLLGGVRHGRALDESYVRNLAQAVRARHQRDGGSVMVLGSRRTPDVLYAALCEALRDVPGIRWANAGDGTNPYPGVLGWADRLVVTPDSVNMLSEACATGRPVHTLADTELPDKLRQFHSALRERGVLHDIDAETGVAQPALRETGAVASAVRERLALDTRTAGNPD